MEDPEVPTEHLHESIEEKVEELGKRGWSIYLAISTAFMAVLAALSSLQAGYHSDEALISQVKASDQWSFYQAKGIKSEIAQLMFASNAGDTAKLNKKIAQYKSDQADIKKIAQEDEEESHENLSRHVILARAVTFFQVSIAISAISIMTKRRFLWYIALAISLAGVFQFVMGNI